MRGFGPSNTSQTSNPMEIYMTTQVQYIHAQSALNDAANSAHLCYWLPKQEVAFHDASMRDALARAAKHLGYVLTPITQEDGKNILPADEING